MEKKRPVLSISMLVSDNRRDTIEKCMESLVPLRKAVPSELIIVDTGCTDGSIEIARKYADQVIRFDWCNDFAAARNAGLFACTGEWFMYLDDDEWFEDVSELISFFKGQEKEKYDAVWYIARNYQDFEGISYTDAHVGRIVKFVPGLRFCGKIHEWLQPVAKKIKKVTSFVHHYGYAFKTEEDRQKHSQRNVSLLLDYIKEFPEDIRMCCQLVQEYRAVKQYEDALALAEKTLSETKFPATSLFVQYLWLATARCYNGMEKYEKALEVFLKIDKEIPLSHEAKLVLHHERAVSYGFLEREEELQQECRRYLAEYDREPEEEEFPVMDLSGFASTYVRQVVARYGILSIVRSGIQTYAEEFFDAIDWEENKEEASKLISALFQSYTESGNAGLLLKNLPKAVCIREMEELIYGNIDSFYRRYPERREAFLETLEQLQLRSGNFAYFHLVYTIGKGITTFRDVQEYYELSDRKYDEEVMKLLSDKVDFTKLEECREYLLLAADQEKIEWEMLESYLAGVKQTAGHIFHAEWSSLTGMTWLPGEFRFVVEIEEALRNSTDMATWGEKLKCAAKADPTMVSVVRALAGERPAGTAKEESVLQKEKDEQTELLALAKQLKEMVRNQIAAGKKEEARAILTELSMILPEDPEVKKLLTLTE